MAEGSSVEQLQHQETAVQLEVRGPPLSVTDRYYTKHYAVGKDGLQQTGVVTGSHWEHFCALPTKNLSNCKIPRRQQLILLLSIVVSRARPCTSVGRACE